MTISINRRVAKRFAVGVFGVALCLALWGSQALPPPGSNRVHKAISAASEQEPLLPDIEGASAIFVPMSFDEAERRNSLRPFSALANPPATPFRSRLAGRELERAVTCLAVAALYEAGGARHNQLPVMQVILNRVRHPAYPSSICDVVFQGSERSTGCQFTFTCDGAMARWRPSGASIEGARALAARMLEGRLVDERVGWATHYHTDWVLPYWSPNLVKLTAVETHIFYRWPGTWGQQAAFRQSASPHETPVKALASIDPAHLPNLADEEETAIAAADTAMGAGEAPLLLAALSRGEDQLAYPEQRPGILQLDVTTSPGRWAIDAVRHCGRQTHCRVVGWTDTNPCDGNISRECLTSAPPDFLYIQVLRERVQTAYWNCAKWPQGAGGRCLGSPGQTATLAFAQL